MAQDVRPGISDELEKQLIEQCSATLASLKSASLFRTNVPSTLLAEWIARWNERLCDKGVSLCVLWSDENASLVYVCRRSHLQSDLNAPGVTRFLRAYGYEDTDAAAAVAHLRARFAECRGFPHEIGVFLGYPLGDVIGFIDNGGKNAKCTGCWKVYCDECRAKTLFARFRKCRDVYSRLWRAGTSVRRLTVAA